MKDCHSNTFLLPFTLAGCCYRRSQISSSPRRRLVVLRSRTHQCRTRSRPSRRVMTHGSVPATTIRRRPDPTEATHRSRRASNRSNRARRQRSTNTLPGSCWRTLPLLTSTPAEPGACEVHPATRHLEGDQWTSSRRPKMTRSSRLVQQKRTYQYLAQQSLLNILVVSLLVAVDGCLRF